MLKCELEDALSYHPEDNETHNELKRFNTKPYWSLINDQFNNKFDIHEFYHFGFEKRFSVSAHRSNR